MKALTGIALVVAALALAAAVAIGLRLHNAERRGAAEAGRSAGGAEALAPQIESLRGEIAALRETTKRLEARVEEATSRAGPAEFSAETLLPLLEHMDPQLRRSAIGILKGLRDPISVEALTRTAEFDVDPNVRKAAIEALAGFAHEAVRKILLGMLESPEDATRQMAAEGLGKLRDPELFEPLAALFEREFARARPPRPGYSHSVPSTLRVALKALSDTDVKKSVPYVLRTLKMFPGDYSMEQLMNAIALPENVPALVAFAGKLPPAPVRRGSSSSRSSPHYRMLQTFERLRDKRAVAYIETQLGSADTSLRSQAARALVACAGDAAFEKVIAALRRTAKELEGKPESSSSYGASGIVSALTRTQDPRACSVFVDLLVTCRNKSVRNSLTSGLQNCVDPAQGERIYALWKRTKNETLKRSLRQVLQYKREYGYIWDEAANDFKRREDAPAPVPRPHVLAPRPAPVPKPEPVVPVPVAPKPVAPEPPPRPDVVF